MDSLRARLLVGTLVANAVLLAGCATLVFVLVDSALHREFDLSLGIQARALTSLVEQDGAHLQLEYDAEQLPEYARAERPEYFCFWTSDGQVLYRSPSLGAALLALPGRPAGAETSWWTLTLPDGRPGRAATLVFTPHQDGRDDAHQLPAGRRAGVTVAVARDTLATADELRRLAWLLCAVGGAAIVIGGGVMTWLTRRLLRPVEQLAGRIASLDANALGGRVDDHGVPAELRPVTGRLNDLLGRLESAFMREKSFTADAAHELRTPLAGLRTTIEVALVRARESGAYQIVLGECLGICAEMQILVDNLLSLARLEAGKVMIERSAFDLSALLVECWKPCQARAEEGGVQLAWAVPAGTQLVGDREKLRLVLQNLFNNAVSYVERGGDISLNGGVDGAGLTLRLANSGCRLRPEQLGQVFERFWRGDAARSGTGVHCGLGLALCRKIVELLQGRITAGVVDGRFVIELSLPAAPIAR